MCTCASDARCEVLTTRAVNGDSTTLDEDSCEKDPTLANHGNLAGVLFVTVPLLVAPNPLHLPWP